MIEKDVIQIHLNSNPKEKSRTYSFQYNAGIWIEAELDLFEVDNHFDEIEQGKLKKS